MNVLVNRATGASTKGDRSKMIAEARDLSNRIKTLEAQSARGEVPKASILKGASK